jgi:hypothetical protein
MVNIETTIQQVKERLIERANMVTKDLIDCYKSDMISYTHDEEWEEISSLCNSIIHHQSSEQEFIEAVNNAKHIDGLVYKIMGNDDWWCTYFHEEYLELMSVMFDTDFTISNS